jgi:hypothetical protein
MALPANAQQLNYGVPAVVTGHHRQVISGVGATRTLASNESGSVCLFDSAAGTVYTLPPPVLGMEFEFRVTVTRTSNAHKIITDAATTFLVGAVALLNNAATTGEAFSADGTTIRALSSNGTTTGGIIGDRYRVTAISTTQWSIEGVLVQSGTAATPFATS